MKAAWKIAIVLAVAGAVAGTLALRGEQDKASEETATVAVSNDAAADSSGPTDAAVETTEADAPLPRLVDLGADKCIPCKAMAPILEELEEEYAGTFEVQFIDVWKNPDAGKKYEIQMIPTQIFYDADGEERTRHTGFMGKEDILAQFEEMGVL
ncbi:MAG: thioredoxin family protein [Candidatus Hydrogenedentota bacterium]